MERFKIKQNKNATATLYKKIIKHIDSLFLIFFVIMSFSMIAMEKRSNHQLLRMKNNIQFDLLRLTNNFQWVINPLNKFLLRWNLGNNFQYNEFLSASYVENSDFKKLSNENMRLKRLLKFLDASNLQNRKYLTTRIIGNIGSTFGFIKLGTRDGVKNNQAVINEFGLLGKIVGAGECNAKVMFVTDRNCRILAITGESNYKIITSGSNESLLDVLYLPDNKKLKIGELVVTSEEMDFPADIRIGTINNGGKISPIVNFNNVDFITIIAD